MKEFMKRLVSFLLVLMMVASLLPAVHAQGQQTEELTDADYAAVQDVFAQIDAAEAKQYKNATQTQKTDAAEKIVLASDNYVEGSLERNGNAFTWWTEEGIRCTYNPRMRQQRANRVVPENPETAGIYNEPVTTKGGWPSGNQVYLIGPYYGLDSNFTNQYKYEAEDIAEALGDTDGYTLYSGSAATIDKVAEAVSKGAVVIFDSHGSTDYENPNDEYDYVTGANYSYLCLSTKTGLTQADYDAGAVWDGYDAFVNGAAIANHMTSNSPGGLLWMAICLGMATNTMCTPMRNKGVEVVYGYSQSVTFAGDYLFEGTFWDEMCEGANVSEAAAAMKAEWGNWDWSVPIADYYGYDDGYTTISSARADYCAFPVVVSDEDTHPGQRKNDNPYGADSLQTVQSTYTLFSQYNITAQSSNTAYGTVSVSGRTVTATPAAGYFAQGYTVVSGNATVSQNGNTFTVNAQSDCVIRINFAPKTAVTVSFSGANVGSQTGYAGDSMTLPKTTAPEGYTFLGWMDTPMTGETTEKPACYTDSFIPTGNTTLYALYSYVDENSTTGTGDYVRVNSTPEDWSGEYVIVYEADGYIFDGSLTSFDAVNNYREVSIYNDTIFADEADNYRFIIAPYGNGYSIQGISGGYIGPNSINNGLTTSSSPLENTISLDASGDVNIISDMGTYLRYNNTSGQNRFRFYRASTYSNQQPIALYLKDGSAGTTYYTGTTVLCEHANTVTVDAVEATCITDGWTAGVFCSDCENYISGHQPITSPGHSYEAVVTPPTATEQGYTTYTCSVCGAGYVSDYEEALGETHTVSFCVPTGVEKIADMLCGKNGIVLPEAGAPEGYTFAGWATEAAEDTQTAPTIYEAGSIVTASIDLDLYAVYTYVVGGSTTTEYVLTDLSDIQDSDEVVITVNYQGTLYALSSSNGTSKAPTAVIVSYSGDKLTGAVADSLKWNMVKASGGYTIYPAGITTRWLYCTNTNNGIRVGIDSAKVFAMSNGYLKNTAYNRYMGVYRTNPDWRTYTSVHENIANQTYGFYVKSAPGVTYYTTLDAQSNVCRHISITRTTLEATCGTEGYVKEVCNLCGEELSMTILPATGEHTYAPVSAANAGAACSVCGKEVFAWAGMSVSLESSLQASFVVQTANLPESGYYAVIEKEVYDKETGKISIETTRFEASDFVNYNTSGTMKKIVFSGVAAKQMTDRFTVTIYNADGEQISASYTRTIEEYILSLFGNAKTSEAMKVVAVDFLNYGAAAQDKFGYRPTELANRGLTDDLKALATADSAIAGITDARTKGDLLAGTAVAAEYEIIPAFVYQTAKIADVEKAEVSYVNFKGQTVSYEVAAEDFANYNTAGTMKKIEIKGTAVADGASPITVTLIDADGNVLDESIECVNYYCARMVADHEVFNKLLKVICSAKIAFA